MKCKICETRKPRRYCPGVQGDICSICCGKEREVTINCPLDCPYLREAHSHEKVEVDRSQVPNADVEISDAFLRSHQDLAMYVGYSLSRAAGVTLEAVDSDVREALDALTRTYRTLASGLYYDSHPTNPYADRIYSGVQDEITQILEDAKKHGATVRDAEILGILVMYQRLAHTYNHGRPKERPFIGILLEQFKVDPAKAVPASSPLIEI
jgi:hypothetical protein